MSKKKLDYVVFIGRMQPPHKAHIRIIEQAFDVAEHVIVLFGSANQPRTPKNPWSWHEREEMVRSCIQPKDQTRIVFRGVSDTYNDQEWVRSVQETVDILVRRDIKRQEFLEANFNPKIGLIGFEKDPSSFYLKMFPQWTFINVEQEDVLHSTDIRRMMFELQQLDAQYIPTGVVSYIEAFMNSEDFQTLKSEYEFIQKYQMAWAKSPYPPTFVTVDAIVVQAGHVLLVRRRATPGKGNWAMPGGFVGQGERLEDAVLRELREETKLKVPMPVLRGNIKAREVFDDPKRSLRGRTITHAFLIELPPGPLPKVKGSDDADKAKWVPLGVFEKMEGQMFEDHFHIVNHMVDKL